MIRSHHRRFFVLAISALAALATPQRTDAQSLGERLKRKAEEAAKRKLEQRTEKRAEEAADKALDTAECAASDRLCKEKAAQQAAASGASGAAGGAAPGRPGEGAWKNFDFVPGERVLFAEDFAGDDVGDFPKRLTFKAGNLEVVEWEGARFLSTNTFRSSFSVPLPEVLPERFTLEFLYSADGGNHTKIYFVDPERAEGRSYVEIGVFNAGIDGGAVRAMGQPSGDQLKYRNAVIPVRVMADGKHVKVYLGGDRVANVPSANLGRSKAIHFFELPGRSERAAMIGNIRVAAGGRELYDALATKGRVATQGILFESGSDRLRPESTPTLTEIGRMLETHADLKLAIEGHTDNVGDAAANQTLSEKRAAAVKAYLVSTHKVAEARLVAKGFGATKPAVPNTTAEGRQQNRRVELVKM